jgi:energy-coupling factor transporter transmembrane protein EcfT
MTETQNVFEFSWMILFSLAAFFLGLLLIKEVKIVPKSKNSLLLYLGCFIWTLGYSADSIGIYYLSDGSWMVDGDGTSGYISEILLNIKIACSMIGCISVLVSAVIEIRRKRVHQL